MEKKRVGNLVWIEGNCGMGKEGRREGVEIENEDGEGRLDISEWGVGM